LHSPKLKPAKIEILYFNTHNKQEGPAGPGIGVLHRKYAEHRDIRMGQRKSGNTTNAASRNGGCFQKLWSCQLLEQINKSGS
jgi:hypothetical protein